MQVLYDNVSLTTGNYTVRNVVHEDTPPYEQQFISFARQRGGVVVSNYQKSKTITITGIIKGTTKADLEARVDTFKELISRPNKNLDLDYGSGTRRYVVVVNSVKIDRDYYSLSYAEYEVSFLCQSGVGVDPNRITIQRTGITAPVSVQDFVIEGSATPDPNLTVYVAGGTISNIGVMINGDKVSISESLGWAYAVIFNFGNRKVTVNGTEVEYTGFFPRFKPNATNSVQVEVTGVGFQYELTLEYYKTYL